MKITLYSILVFLVVGCSNKVSDHSDKTIETIDGNTLTYQELEDFIAISMDTLNIQGLSIALIENNQITFNNSYGLSNYYTKEKVAENTLFEAASLSKPVFGVFTLKLIEEGLLELDAPLHQLLTFEEIESDKRTKDITPQMILSHTTGLPNWRWQMPNNELGFIEEPGEVFTYSGEAYVYLSKVLAEITNSDLSKLDSTFARTIAEPLELDNFYYGIDEDIWSRMAHGHWNDRLVLDNNWDRTQFNSPGGLYSNPEAYARFLIHLFNKEIISEESLQLFLSIYTEVYPEYKELTGISNWGLGVGIIDSPQGLTIAHGGNNFGYTSGFAYHINSGTGYVFMSNSDQVSDFTYNLEELLFPNLKIY